MKNSQTKSHVPLLILAVAVVLVVVALFLFVRQRVEISTSKAVTARSVVSSEQASKSREQDMVKLYEETTADRARLSSFFIPADGVVTFIEAVEAIGAQSGTEITLSSISTDAMDKITAGKLGAVRAHVTASGSWSAVMKILALSEAMPYDVIVDNVRLDSSGAVGGKRGWNISYDIRATMMPNSSTSPAVK